MLNVLLSSVGRRSQLIETFREALIESGVRGRLLGTDAAPELAPGAHLVDECFVVPRCSDPGFIDEVLRIAIAQDVRLIIPTIDTELPAFSANRQRFLDKGINISISSPETIRIACDKVETSKWLVENGFPNPRQANSDEVLQNPGQWKFPLILKPRFGSASSGVVVVKSRAHLQELAANAENLIVQEIAQGEEYTVNLFIQDGKCVCVVPHRRIETRGGEVSKGITTRDDRLMTLAAAIAEKLPGACGALNVQCFLDPDGLISVVEINARFGGGFPLSNRAGAKFPLWLLEPLVGKPSSANNQWEDRLLMLRYDAAVFISKAGSRYDK